MECNLKNLKEKKVTITKDTVLKVKIIEVNFGAKTKSDSDVLMVRAADSSGEGHLCAYGFAAKKFAKSLCVNNSYSIENFNDKVDGYDNYSIVLNLQTQIKKLEEKIPMILATAVYVDFEMIADLSENAIINVKGIISDVEDIREVVSVAKNKTYRKREILLKDMSSELFVNVTVWNQFLSQDFNVGSMLDMKNGRVTIFYGERRISSTMNSVIKVTAMGKESAGGSKAKNRKIDI